MTAVVVLRPGIFELLLVVAMLLAVAGLGRAALGARWRGEPLGPAVRSALKAGAPAGRSLALTLGAAYAAVVLFGLLGVMFVIELLVDLLGGPTVFGPLFLVALGGFLCSAVLAVVQLTRAGSRFRAMRRDRQHRSLAGDLGVAIVVVGGLGLYSLAALVRPEWASDPHRCPATGIQSVDEPSSDVVWPPVSLPEASSLEAVLGVFGLETIPRFEGGHPRDWTMSQNSETGGADLVLQAGTHIEVSEVARRFERIMATQALTSRGGSSSSGLFGTHATMRFEGEGFDGVLVARDCPGRRNRVTLTISVGKDRVGACQPPAARSVCAMFYELEPRPIAARSDELPFTAARVVALPDGRLRLSHQNVRALPLFPRSAAADLQADLEQDGWTVTISSPGRLDAPARLEATTTVAGVPVVLHRDFQKDAQGVVTSGFVETKAPIASQP